MAHRRGFEPLTYRLEGGCSIQLSYQCVDKMDTRNVWPALMSPRIFHDSMKIIPKRPDIEFPDFTQVD